MYEHNEHELVRGEEYRVIDTGKTKIVIEGTRDNEVFLREIPFLTKGDGEREDYLEGKDEWCTAFSCNCFKLLQKAGIPTHFIEQVDGRTTRAKRLEMLPFEVVERGIAFGSFCKRNLEISEGTIFKNPVVELFFKNDVPKDKAKRDPLAIYDIVGDKWLFYKAKVPRKNGFIAEIPKITIGEQVIREWEIFQLVNLVRLSFEKLREAWEKQDVKLVDLKIECGFVKGTSDIVIGDVFTLDTCRAWPKGKKELARDKEKYRQAKEMTPKIYKRLQEDYAWGANATSKFFY